MILTVLMENFILYGGGGDDIMNIHAPPLKIIWGGGTGTLPPPLLCRFVLRIGPPPKWKLKPNTIHIIQRIAISLILVAQKSFFYPQKRQAIVFKPYFIVKAVLSLFLGQIWPPKLDSAQIF